MNIWKWMWKNNRNLVCFVVCSSGSSTHIVLFCILNKLNPSAGSATVTVWFFDYISETWKRNWHNIRTFVLSVLCRTLFGKKQYLIINPLIISNYRISTLVGTYVIGAFWSFLVSKCLWRLINQCAFSLVLGRAQKSSGPGLLFSLQKLVWTHNIMHYGKISSWKTKIHWKKEKTTKYVRRQINFMIFL